jgi:hypothetical protein
MRFDVKGRPKGCIEYESRGIPVTTLKFFKDASIDEIKKSFAAS